jgi:putative membrane protein
VPHEEPDYRFTLANERTHLAYVRTALAFLAGGVALAEASSEGGQRLLAAAAVLIGALIGLTAHWRWRRADQAIRSGDPLPRSRSLILTSVAVGVLALGALTTMLVDAVTR